MSVSRNNPQPVKAFQSEPFKLALLKNESRVAPVSGVEFNKQNKAFCNRKKTIDPLSTAHENMQQAINTMQTTKGAAFHTVEKQRTVQNIGRHFDSDNISDVWKSRQERILNLTKRNRTFGGNASEIKFINTNIQEQPVHDAFTPMRLSRSPSGISIGEQHWKKCDHLFSMAELNQTSRVSPRMLSPNPSQQSLGMGSHFVSQNQSGYGSQLQSIPAQSQMSSQIMSQLKTQQKAQLFTHKMQKLPDVTKQFNRTRIFDQTSPNQQEEAHQRNDVDDSVLEGRSRYPRTYNNSPEETQEQTRLRLVALREENIKRLNAGRKTICFPAKMKFSLTPRIDNKTTPLFKDFNKEIDRLIETEVKDNWALPDVTSPANIPPKKKQQSSPQFNKTFDDRPMVQPLVKVQKKKKQATFELDQPTLPPKKETASPTKKLQSLRSILVKGIKEKVAEKEKTVTMEEAKKINYQRRKKPVMKFAANSGWELDEEEMASAFCAFDLDKELIKLREKALIPEVEKEVNKFLNYINEIKDQCNQASNEIDDLCVDAKESLFQKTKHNIEQRDLLKLLIADCSNDPSFKKRFLEGILLPNKLNEEHMMRSQTHVQRAISDTQKAAQDQKKKIQKFKDAYESQRHLVDSTKITQAKWALDSQMRRGRKIKIIEEGEEMLEEDLEQDEPNFINMSENLVRKDEKKKNMNENRIDHRYLDTLMFKHNKLHFLLKDTHDVFGHDYNENSFDIQKEFAKNCYQSHDAVPNPSLIIQDWFKDDLYALLNISVTPEQSLSLAKVFKYYGQSGKDIKEIIFANNSISDKQFAEFLTHIIDNEAQFNNLQKISYGGQNELGQNTINVLDRLIKDKHPSFPLTHLALVNCKRRSRIEPLFQTLEQRENYISTLILPHQNFGETGFRVLCDMIQKFPTSLRVLDISWNELFGHQIKPLFEALSKNRDLEHLNLAMTSLHPDTDLAPLMRFIKKCQRLIHLDFSGMFKTDAQVISVIKKIKNHQTLLSLHLSHTPIISTSPVAQAYIQHKLGITKVHKHCKASFSANEILKQKLEKDWILRDKLQSECNVVEKVSEYYKNMRSTEGHPGDDDHLIIQRTIGYPSLVGNQKWIARNECYICQRWQITCLLYQPDMRHKMNQQRNQDGTVKEEEYYISGSYESLMQSTGDEQWTKSKMVPIKRFIEDFDPNYISWETYETMHFQTMTIEEETAQKAKRIKLAAQRTKWRIEYDNNLVKQIRNFIIKNKKKTTGHFNIIPNDIEQQFDVDLMCYADFVKPTCKVELMIVTSKNQPTRGNLMMHPFVPQVNLKNLRVKRYEQEKPDGKEGEKKVHVKEMTIFEPWKVDTDFTYKQCAQEDFTHWKVNKICKDDPSEVAKVEEIVQKYYDQLKQIYTQEISTIEYPHIGMNHFGFFAQACKMTDKNFELCQIDRLFTAANYEIVQDDNNPDKKLQRYEFMELLVRIAQVKFCQTKICASVSEAFEKLLQEHVFKNYKLEPWQEFREEELWQQDAHDVFEANLEALAKVYAWINDSRGPTGVFAYKKAIALVTKETEVHLEIVRAHKCFGMSKMTVKKETEHAAFQFNILKPVEFYEYIGRVAKEKFRHETDLAFAEMIERTLDLIFPTFNLRRHRHDDVEDDEIVYSESDDSIDLEDLDLSNLIMSVNTRDI